MKLNITLNKKLLILILFVLTFFVSSLYWVYSQRNEIKKFLIEKINSNTGIELKYARDEISIFPNVGIQLYEVSLEKKGGLSFSAKLEELSLNLSLLKLLFNQFNISGVKLIKGKILISQTNSNENSTNSFDPKLLTSLSIEDIDAQEIDIEYSFEKITEEIKIIKFSYDRSILGSNAIDLKLKYKKGALNAKLSFETGKSISNFDELYFKSDINLDNFPIQYLKKYYSIFRKNNFDNIAISGNIFLIKKANSKDIPIETELTINSLNFKGLESSPAIELNSKLNWNTGNLILSFISTKVKMGNFVSGSTSGELKFGKTTSLFLDINTNYAKLDSIIPFILDFTSVDYKTSPDLHFFSLMKIRSSYASFLDYKFTKPNLEIRILDTRVDFLLNHVELFEGNFTGKGYILAENQVSYDFDINVDQVNVDTLIHKYSNKKFITGELAGKFKLISKGDTIEEFYSNIDINGKSKITNGKLLGYANILRPILTLGKFINFRGPKGDSANFQSINLKFLVKKRLVDIPELKMVGVGLDADGKGKIDFNRKINFRLNVGLGGIAGKAIYVPILYTGIIPETDAYIDPIWISTIYLGATILGGPTGIAVGGIAGSTVSEYVNRAYDSVKKIFFWRKEEKNE
ncbi:MAG: AsmA-like C-terminal region-containing protein [Leptospiraceae bacterium]|nr:AsmA-like C-terminal region-containing protein [Leptospiraceae bacterium]